MNRFQYHPYQNDEYMSMDPQYVLDINQTSTSYVQSLQNQLDPRLEHCELDLVPGNLSLGSSAYRPSAILSKSSPNWSTEAPAMTNNDFWPHQPQRPHQGYQCNNSAMLDASMRYSNPNIEASFTDSFPRHFNSLCDPRLLEGNGMDIEAPEPSEYHYGFGDSHVTGSLETCHGLLDADSFGGEDFARLTLDKIGTEDELNAMSPSPVDYDYPCSAFPRLSNEDRQDLNTADEILASEGSGEEPYAKLIYKALMTKESRAMVLQEIYEWFLVNTNKANSKTKGWQNSIRHNLSMNGAFIKRERAQSGEDSKKHCEWVLDAVAERDGVKSTTRYRNKILGKRITKHDPPSGARQNSGRLGGQRSAGRLRARKQQKIKTEPPDRLEQRPCRETRPPNEDLFTCRTRSYPLRHSQSLESIKVEGADAGSSHHYKEDPHSAFGKVKGIFEDVALHDLPPFVSDNVSCLTPTPKTIHGYQYHPEG